MKIAIDFDGTIVKQNRPYADTDSPLEFSDGAKRALLALKAAGHSLLLWSGRASRALLFDPTLDPFVRAGAIPLDMERWRRSQSIHVARHLQMLAFVAAELPGVFDAIDDGACGKPSVDLFIDDRALAYAGGNAWFHICEMYGAAEKLRA